MGSRGYLAWPLFWPLVSSKIVGRWEGGEGGREEGDICGGCGTHAWTAHENGCLVRHTHVYAPPIPFLVHSLYLVPCLNCWHLVRLLPQEPRALCGVCSPGTPVPCASRQPACTRPRTCACTRSPRRRCWRGGGGRQLRSYRRPYVARHLLCSSLPCSLSPHPGAHTCGGPHHVLEHFIRSQGQGP